MKQQRLGHLPSDSEHRVERSHGVLKDHRDRLTADLLHLRIAQLREISPLEQDLAADDPPRPRDEPHDAQGGHRLAAPRLSDDAQGLARMELERDAVHRFDDPLWRLELRLQVADLE